MSEKMAGKVFKIRGVVEIELKQGPMAKIRPILAVLCIGSEGGGILYFDIRRNIPIYQWELLQDLVKLDF